MAISQNDLVDEPTGATDPTNTQQPTEPNQPATLPAGPAAQAVEDDIDRDLRLAREQLANEQSTAAAAPGAPVPAATPAAAPASIAPAAPAPKQQMVPLAAAMAERNKRQEAERENAYLKGKLDAMTATGNSGGEFAPAPAAAVETPEQALGRINAERLTLADEYDNGNIRTREWEERRQKLNDEEWKLRSETIAPAAPQMPLNVALWQEQETQRIESAYPILNALTQADVEPMVAMARREAEREGSPILAGPQGTIQLRERVAKIATRMYGTGTPAAPASPNRPAAPAAPAQHANATAAALAASHPVDINTIGAVGNNSVGVSDEQALAALGAMNESDQLRWMSANPAIVNRALGRAPP